MDEMYHAGNRELQERRSSWAVDVLPAGDPALDPDASVV
jgi:hypothetical protein